MHQSCSRRVHPTLPSSHLARVCDRRAKSRHQAFVAILRGPLNEWAECANRGWNPVPVHGHLHILLTVRPQGSMRLSLGCHLLMVCFMQLFSWYALKNEQQTEGPKLLFNAALLCRLVSNCAALIVAYSTERCRLLLSRLIICSASMKRWKVRISSSWVL